MFINTQKKNTIVFSISGINNISNIIIPIFNKYKIKGVKALDYKYFCKATELVNSGIHTTLKGLEQVREIKSRMNKCRYISMST